MIDTVKIYCNVTEEIRNVIMEKGQVRNSYNLDTGEVYYNIILNQVEMSYSSNINLRVNRFNAQGYILDIEGSLHKILKGQNAYSGFYNLKTITKTFKDIIEKEYNIKLPSINDFFLLRIDIAKVFDLYTQRNVREYINYLSNLYVPRKKIDYHLDSGIYMASSLCTLKIYNKFLEYKKNDKFKLQKKNLEYKKLNNIEYDLFNIYDFEQKIQGYIRFECEIKNRFLRNYYKNLIEKTQKDIKVVDVKYKDLEKIWEDEFKKMYNYKIEKIIYDKNLIQEKLINVYGNRKGNNLYSFYNLLMVEGLKKLRINSAKSTFRRKLKELKDCGISFEKKYKIENINKKELPLYLKFNPFNSLKEIA